MPEYRRAFIPGGTFFFTVVTEGRAPLFGEAHARALLGEAFREVRGRRPFEIDAIVLLPDHLHTVWRLPDNDHDFSARWSMLKRIFTKAWLAKGGREQHVSMSRRRNRRCGVWQRRFWEHTIRDETDYVRHCDYIHYNPVKHGLVACPHAWQYSSFQRLVRAGLYERSWMCTCSGGRVKALDFTDLRSTAIE